MRTQPRLHGIFATLALVLIVLAAGIGTAGYSYYIVQKQRVKQESQDQLSAVAELKVNEIARWRDERLADARIAMDTPFIASLVKDCFNCTGSETPMQEIIQWMKSYKEHYDYFSVSLLDVDEVIRLSIPDGEQSDDDLLETVSQALVTQEPILGDLEHTDIVKRIHLDLIIPLTIPERGVRQSVGALLLRIDPHKFLYPLIRSWPTGSRSAETLLVRREENEVVFLNELRHRKDEPLSLRLPLTDTAIPAVMAAQGREGKVEGMDYRRTSVLAAIKRVPETSWYLIAKIDEDEVYTPVRERAILMAFLVTLMIAGAGVTLGFTWSFQRSQLYLQQYRTEAEKLEIARRYEHITRNANDIILLVKEDGRITEANQRALTAYGYPSDEMIGMDMTILETHATLSMLEEHMRLTPDQDGFVFETVHRRKDGTTFPVEISIRIVELMEGSFYLQIIRDIGERKMAELALREAHDSLDRRVRERTAALQALNEQLGHEVKVRKQAEKELRAVTVRLASTEESERRRLARELHDRVGQNLTALNFNISSLANLLSADTTSEAVERLEDSSRLVEETVRCVRDVMADLRPPLLDDYGLAAVLRWYCREFSERSGMAAVVECAGEIPRLSPSVEIALFRIAQEALTNAMRHAQATLVTAKLTATSQALRMSISDNGVGFDPKDEGSPQTHLSGWGMISMRERAEMAGGRLLVASAPGGGSCITVEIAR